MFLLDALCRTGNLRRLVDDAVKSALLEGRKDDAQLYRAVSDQIANSYRR